MKISRTNNFELVAKLNQYVHDVHSNLYPEYFKKYNYEAIKEFFKGIIYNPKYIFLLLEDDEQPLGYAWIEVRKYPENAFKKSYKSIYVHQLSIVDNQRNNGYGSRLMEAISEVARVNGISKIEIDYWTDNENAKNFYKKNDLVIYREHVYKDII